MTKVKIKFMESTVREQEVELPRYYSHFMDHSTVYGKIDIDRTVSFTEFNSGGIQCEVKTHDPSNICSSYFKKMYDSNEESFLEARDDFMGLAGDTLNVST